MINGKCDEAEKVIYIEKCFIFIVDAPGSAWQWYERGASISVYHLTEVKKFYVVNQNTGFHKFSLKILFFKFPESLIIARYVA